MMKTKKEVLRTLIAAIINFVSKYHSWFSFLYEKISQKMRYPIDDQTADKNKPAPKDYLKQKLGKVADLTNRSDNPMPVSNTE